MDMVSGIMGEIKRNPYTSVAALACFFALPVMWTMKADAGDVQKLEQTIASVENTVRRESTATELSNVRRELFDIDLRIKTLERENISVDRLLYQRRDELQSQTRRLEAKLAQLDGRQ